MPAAPKHPPMGASLHRRCGTQCACKVRPRSCSRCSPSQPLPSHAIQQPRSPPHLHVNEDVVAGDVVLYRGRHPRRRAALDLRLEVVVAVVLGGQPAAAGWQAACVAAGRESEEGRSNGRGSTKQAAAAAAVAPTCGALQLCQATRALRRGQELPRGGQHPLHSGQEVWRQRGLGFVRPAGGRWRADDSCQSADALGRRRGRRIGPCWSPCCGVLSCGRGSGDQRFHCILLCALRVITLWKVTESCSPRARPWRPLERRRRASMVLLQHGGREAMR